MNRLVHFGIAAAFILLANAASAHHLWLEVDGKTAQLYYGEFGGNLREVSPGLLDKLEPQAKAVSSAGERAMPAKRTSKAFELVGDLKPGESVIAEDPRYPIFVRSRDGTTTRSMYWPAARYVADGSAVKPTLTLDVVPAGGEKFQIFFKGKPLAKAKVEVVAAFGWSKEERTDDEGMISISLPWRGSYALEVQHADRNPGKRGDEAYDTATYVTTLTLAHPQGATMPPLPPPAKPNRSGAFRFSPGIQAMVLAATSLPRSR